MKSIKSSNLYELVTKEFNYSFADIYIINNVVVSEIKTGVIFSWDNHAKIIIKDILNYLGADGAKLTYISNRINTYSVVPTDWLKFYKNNNKLLRYYVVGTQKSSFINTAFENLFFNSSIKKFTTIEDAVDSAVTVQYESSATV